MQPLVREERKAASERTRRRRHHVVEVGADEEVHDLQHEEVIEDLQVERYLRRHDDDA
jgi:hypothetical protein